MLVSCWSAKGGSGATVVAAALASVLSHRSDQGSLLVDAAGDLPLLLGLREPDGPGLTEWVAAGPDVPADALARLELPVRPGVRLLPRGNRVLDDPARVEVLAAVLAGDPRPVVVDVGLVTARPGDGPAAESARVLAVSATQSLLVTRSCYLSLERAARLPMTPTGIVLLTETGRAYDRREFEDRIGAPVVGEVAVESQIARAADSGSLARRVPRALERGLRHAA
ncbi:MAG TPA: hypothetical protein VIY72_01945 [Acidimicrobiales bacterium]